MGKFDSLGTIWGNLGKFGFLKFRQNMGKFDFLKFRQNLRKIDYLKFRQNLGKFGEICEDFLFSALENAFGVLCWYRLTGFKPRGPGACT